MTTQLNTSLMEMERVCNVGNNIWQVLFSYIPFLSHIRKRKEKSGEILLFSHQAIIATSHIFFLSKLVGSFCHSLGKKKKVKRKKLLHDEIFAPSPPSSFAIWENCSLFPPLPEASVKKKGHLLHG